MLIDFMTSTAKKQSAFSYKYMPLAFSFFVELFIFEDENYFLLNSLLVLSSKNRTDQ